MEEGKVSQGQKIYTDGFQEMVEEMREFTGKTKWDNILLLH